MDKSDVEEEFAPLFDYSGVHSAGLHSLSDDDLDDSPVVSNGSRKRKDCKEVVNMLDEEGEDGDEKKKKEEDEDWMPPPPKMRCISSAVFEDNTLKALRSTKEELASLAEAAKDLLNSASEFGNSDVCILENSAEDTKEDKCFAKVERERIVISILDDKGGQQQFRLFVDDKFERLFKTYAEKVKVKPESLVFSFDGERVSPTATPAGLGLEKDDIIEVNVLSSFDQCECVDR
ncbi:uncharacterized protein LOC110098801 isoform X1 [Dendrobium catenatum]|uniref:Rad60/SUMO-like domain-containing protein n=1 Tax=Dendrobium catenatum TaxID=906689 RepID=A0A2I0W9A8_9ASPA|nr:uncharacterized protein LOC110098801 isoform X1 [Dendrobium catenatum]PKU72240.1 hypothetical protein MA16_Dca006240 [Dendrobium catenatum]